jgi:hypothetical protein
MITKLPITSPLTHTFILEGRLWKYRYRDLNEQWGYEDERTNVGSTNTSGALTGRLGIVSNQITRSEVLKAPYQIQPMPNCRN